MDLMEIEGKVNTAICYARVVEDEAIKQIRRMCDYAMTEGSRIRIMPDVHAGKGCTIGTTMGFENPQAIYKWMAGRSLPSLDNLIILSRILHISMEDILVVDGDVVFYRVLNQRYNDRNSLGHYGIFRRIIRELQSYGRKLLEDEGLFDIYGSVCIC